MITVSLQGGLGNQLFQLAALDSISKQTGRTPYLEETQTPNTHHSKEDYFQSIFLESKTILRTHLPAQTIYEPSYAFRQWDLPPSHAKLIGYFQNHQYISEPFLESLWLPNVPSLTGAFLHIRGGDYINNPFHSIDLTSYYERAVALFPKGTTFYVFTNDIPYAESLSFLRNLSCVLVEEPNEVRTLAYMKNCTLGGICANSTFSWWGAYLNRKDRTLVLPTKWFNDASIYIDGYFFPGSVQCPV